MALIDKKEKESFSIRTLLSFDQMSCREKFMFFGAAKRDIVDSSNFHTNLSSMSLVISICNRLNIINI